MAGKVPTYYHLYRIRLAFKTNRHVRVWRANHPVRHQFFCSPKVHGRDLIQHATLIGNGPGKYNIKGRDSIGSYHSHDVTEVVHITNFTFIKTSLASELEVRFLDCLHT